MSDVPISNAMLCWNHGFRGATPGAAVVLHPDNDDKSARYESSVGACFAGWRDKDKRGQQLQLLIDAWHVAAFYEVPIQQVHEALLVVPEYREMLARDCLPTEYAHERED